jgi:hypothetical protein
MAYNGTPMALNSKPAWILGGALLIAATSTLGGCISAPLADSTSAKYAGTADNTDGSTSGGRPIANVFHVLRDALADPASVSVSVFTLFGLPIVFIGNAN